MKLTSTRRILILLAIAAAIALGCYLWKPSAAHEYEPWEDTLHSEIDTVNNR